jgi:uncharacterized protein YgiM (DUF1202 family)
MVCISDDVRVRSAPSLSGSIRGLIDSGTVVTVSGTPQSADGYDWLQILVHNSNLGGYAAADFFEETTGGADWAVGTEVHVASDNVNMRSAAGLGNAIVASFNTGTNGVIKGGPRSANGYRWYNLTVDGVTGWMAADFLAEGFVGRPNPGGQFQIGTTVRPTSDLNLRSKAGTGASIIGVYGPDTLADIIDGPSSANGYAWYRVELWDNAGTVGWFAGDFLEIARFEPTGSRHRIIDGPVNLRSGSGLSAPIIRTLSTGTIVVIADASFATVNGYTWMNVYLEADPSVRGWMAQGFSEEI